MLSNETGKMKSRECRMLLLRLPLVTAIASVIARASLEDTHSIKRAAFEVWN